MGLMFARRRQESKKLFEAAKHNAHKENHKAALEAHKKATGEVEAPEVKKDGPKQPRAK